MIEINNLTTGPDNEEFLKKVAQKVLEGENKKGAELSIALVGQGRIKELNKRYRGKNRATDVLSFPESKVFLDKFKVGPIQKTPSLGEIVICLREVKKNAKTFGLTFEKELATCLIHGILHLLGYNHESSEEKEKKMKKKQNHYLKITQQFLRSG